MKAHLGAIARKSQIHLARELIDGVLTGYPPSPRNLSGLLNASPHFAQIAKSLSRKQHRLQIVVTPARFSPAPAFMGLQLPTIATAGDLAAWLELPIAQLDWFADTRRQHRRAQETALRHYHYMFIVKSNGLPRLLESPKARLKAIQRRILHEILDHVPAHDLAHGFVKGRSCISAARAHASEACVLALDLKNFFHSIANERVHGLFRSLGYPWSVARLLTGLCTTATPNAVLQERTEFDWHARKLLAQPHLPQGAPTSPAIANLCTWRLDQRLRGLANRFDANYTRYADDMAFSGGENFAQKVKYFTECVSAFSRDEGFNLNTAKTRVMRAHVRQSVAGVVVNTHTNIARPDYDRLKAILHNCGHASAASQNRDGHADFRAHLNGRVNWVENLNPARGAKLRALFDQIVW